MRKLSLLLAVIMLLTLLCACDETTSTVALEDTELAEETVDTETAEAAETPEETAVPEETPAPTDTPVPSYGPAPTYEDRYWTADTHSSSKDSGTAKLPSNYRTMEDEFGSHEGMGTPPDMPTPDANGQIELPDGTKIDAKDMPDMGSSNEELLADPPSREGMDTLRISGSGEFNADSFVLMIEDIRSRTDGVIVVFDLRQETHGLVNGRSYSLYKKGNTGNVGLNAEEVLVLEKEQLGALLGTELTITSSTPSKKDSTATPKPATVIDVDSVMTEQELCESAGVQYVRISCTDHLCPEDEDVDDFMTALLALPEDAWLHFHCAAGVGRTGLFMMMADIYRNPTVALEDIIERQVLLGANNPSNDKGPEGEDSGAKLDLLERFYAYVQAEKDAGFPDTFSAWSAAK